MPELSEMVGRINLKKHILLSRLKNLDVRIGQEIFGGS